MTIPSEVLRAMIAAGATAEMLVAAVEADQAIEAARKAEARAKAAAKKRRQRAEVRLEPTCVPKCPGDTEGQQGTSGDEPGQIGTAGDAVAAADKEGPQTPKETTPSKITPSDPKGSSAPKGAGRLRGTRIPDDFETQPAARDVAASFGFEGHDASEVLAEFCDYWRPLPGLKATKLDWIGTLRNRLREVARRRDADRRRSGGRVAGLTALAEQKIAARRQEATRDRTIDMDNDLFPAGGRDAGAGPAEGSRSAGRDGRWPERGQPGTVHDFPGRRAHG